MLVFELIDTHYAPLRQTSTQSEAIAMMEREKLQYYPIVDTVSHKLVGQADLDLIREFQESPDYAIERGSGYGQVLLESNHVLEAAQIMLRNNRTALPVVDREANYLGMVTRNDLVDSITRLLNLHEPGTVLMIEIPARDYMLSDIIRIVESEGARIITLTVQAPVLHDGHFRVSVKLNLDDLSRVGSALRRYGYQITSESSAELRDSDLADRADAFMRYLDI
jgi:acetoin utilization protein AcuB